MILEQAPFFGSKSQAPVFNTLFRNSSGGKIVLSFFVFFEVCFEEQGRIFEHAVELIFFIFVFATLVDKLNPSFFGERFESSLKVHAFHLFNEGEDIALLAASEAIVAL